MRREILKRVFRERKYHTRPNRCSDRARQKGKLIDLSTGVTEGYSDLLVSFQKEAKILFFVRLSPF